MTAIQISKYHCWDKRFNADSWKADHSMMAGIVTFAPADLHGPGVLVIVQTTIAPPANQRQYPRQKAGWKDRPTWEPA
ncbi:hypothetical protein CA54_04210 [Symmachiella macrocystis]|uniref:Uncharacterized protein n=1 Tax=Symmachiella macrocystis TaxID=2527985 RepID=A0A5C6BHJ5_9PLAN|nr:hypothetical protein CA54_04210 [Symmachiella macrocystis]